MHEITIIEVRDLPMMYGLKITAPNDPDVVLPVEYYSYEEAAEAAFLLRQAVKVNRHNSAWVNLTGDNPKPEKIS